MITCWTLRICRLAVDIPPRCRHSRSFRSMFYSSPPFARLLFAYSFRKLGHPELAPSAEEHPDVCYDISTSGCINAATSKHLMGAISFSSPPLKSSASCFIRSTALTMKIVMKGRAYESSRSPKKKPAENDLTVVTVSQTRRRSIS